MKYCWQCAVFSGPLFRLFLDATSHQGVRSRVGAERSRTLLAAGVSRYQAFDGVTDEAGLSGQSPATLRR
jgi:hypothetical protein